MNRIVIHPCEIDNNRISYHYEIEGTWTEVFHVQEPLSIEYSIDIVDLPDSIAVVPLLANILPISWIYDAEIIVPMCDEAFYKSIKDFKQGYRNMYPQIDFAGKLTVGELQDNRLSNKSGATAFFSGGVDAFCTLIRHNAEKPTLIMLWGADVSLEDEEGWSNVSTHLKKISESFEVDYVTVKSNFRKFLNEGLLTQKIKKGGDDWWHGFQHGIGIISHAAPIMYLHGKKTVYIASSFTSTDKGNYTCASDPTIDNYVRFCGAEVVHDGYELNRQEKIQIITDFSKKTGISVPLRVCWESRGGSNCCHCEKCWRTILGLYATGNDPRDYGFNFESISEIGSEIKKKRQKLGKNKESRYKPIWNAIHQNYTKKTIDPGLQWFYSSKFEELETGTKLERCYRKARRFAGKMKRKLMRK